MARIVPVKMSDASLTQDDVTDKGHELEICVGDTYRCKKCGNYFYKDKNDDRVFSISFYKSRIKDKHCDEYVMEKALK